MAEKEMATIYIFGKKYSVPAELTIMNAMEYAGYQLKRGCGCRNGFCGACATIYRVKGTNQLQTCLACSKDQSSIKISVTGRSTKNVTHITCSLIVLLEMSSSQSFDKS